MKQSGTEMTLPPAHKTTVAHPRAGVCCVVLIIQSSDLWVHPLRWNFLWLLVGCGCGKVYERSTKHMDALYSEFWSMGSSPLGLWLLVVGCGYCGPKLYMRYHPTGSVCWTYYQTPRLRRGLIYGGSTSDTLLLWTLLSVNGTIQKSTLPSSNRVIVAHWNTFQDCDKCYMLSWKSLDGHSFTKTPPDHCCSVPTQVCGLYLKCNKESGFNFDMFLFYTTLTNIVF